jgi:hypothetical protein
LGGRGELVAFLSGNRFQPIACSRQPWTNHEEGRSVRDDTRLKVLTGNPGKPLNDDEPRPEPRFSKAVPGNEIPNLVEESSLLPDSLHLVDIVARAG